MKITYCNICGEKIREENGLLVDSTATYNIECMGSLPLVFKTEYGDVCDKCQEYLNTQFTAVFDNYKLKVGDYE